MAALSHELHRLEAAAARAPDPDDSIAFARPKDTMLAR
jgi:hypothetical protein